jgi:hypothetical protein
MSIGHPIRKVVYSLRHRVHTRLREIGCPIDIQKEIVGFEMFLRLGSSNSGPVIFLGR